MHSLLTLSHLLRDLAHAPYWVVDAAKVPVTEDHACVDHGRQVCADGAPYEALHVNELEQLRVLDVLARNITCETRGGGGGDGGGGEG
jgi:hypothetical protein